MATFRDAMLPTLDKLRTGIPTGFGIRLVSLTVRVKTWSGTRVGSGTPTVTDTLIAGSGGRYKVRELTVKDVVASGGKYQEGQLRVGPITPPYPGGPFTAAQLIPPKPSGQAQEVYYGIAAETGETQWCSMAGADTLNALHWYVTLKPTGTVDP
jgi:hypothetical protein